MNANDDLISRQGMLNSLNKYRIEKMSEGKDVSLVWECIDKVLQEPSAQAEHSGGVYTDGYIEQSPYGQPEEVFEFDKTYPLAGLQVEITKGAYGGDYITIKRPERFLGLDGTVYTQDDDRQGWTGEDDELV